MKKKLLILTQYFPPEVGAPQNRLFELAVRLQKYGMEIQVLTAMPNYPKMEIQDSYKGKKYAYEESDGLKIHRTWIYVSKRKSILSRLLNYFSFVISSAWYGYHKTGELDYILCESPPLFLGYSALFLKRKKRAQLIFNVSDLWPESAEKLGVVTNRLLLKFAYRLEEKLYVNAVLVTGQTMGICNNIHLRFPEVKTYWLPNGVDLNYYDPDKVMVNSFRQSIGCNNDDFVFLYAGIIGIAQGIDIILDVAKLIQGKANIKFVLLGNGPEKQRLLIRKNEEKIMNVIFLDAVPKSTMPSVLKAVNASIIPLKKLDLFKGAIPSKIFESLAMKIPVLLGVDGEARDLFIDKGKCGLYFEPENTKELLFRINELIENPDLSIKLGNNGRKFVNDNFNRDTIAQKLFLELDKI